MRGARGVLVGVLVALAAAPVYAQTKANTADKLSQARRSLEETQAKAKALSEKLEDNSREMERVSKRASELAAAVQQNESSLTRAESRRDELTREVLRRSAALSAREAQTRRALVAMLRMERVPALAVVAQPENAQAMLRAASLLQAARVALEKDAALLREDLALLRRDRERLAKALEQARDQAATLKARQKLLDQDIARRNAMDRQLRRDQASLDARAVTLTRDAKSLQDLFNRLSAPPPRVAAQPFARKGSLSAPVAGAVLHRYGERKSSNDTYRGVVLRARAQAVVVAPAEGEVAYTGDFMDYGRMVLLRHKGGYMSLLAGLGQVEARMGQRLRAGEPVGRMGNAGAPELYLELRRDGKPIDPAGWFANVGKLLAARG